MTTFDQRGQNVKNQTNIARNQYNADCDIIHTADDIIQGDKVTGNKMVTIAIVRELETFLKQLQEAAQKGELDADAAADIEDLLKKATNEAEKEQADKSKCLEYIDKAKTVLDKAVGITKSVATLGSILATTYTKIHGWW